MTKQYKDYTDFELANTYFNRIKYSNDSEVDFWDEVNKRRGLMFPIEWLEYNY